MKTIKYLITLTLVAFLSLGCNKTINKGKEYTVEGRLMYNCETPMDNTEFSFRQGDPGILGIKTPLSLLVKTDAEGYFKVVYNGKDANISDFTMRKSGTIMDDIPVFKNIELGNVYFGTPPIDFIVRFVVENTYTNLDTLVVPDFNNSDNFAKRYIAGPFENQIIDTVLNFNYLQSMSYQQGSEMKFISWMTNNHQERIESSIIVTEFCTGELYEAVIKIE